jgi:hypothetical protein
VELGRRWRKREKEENGGCGWLKWRGRGRRGGQHLCGHNQVVGYAFPRVHAKKDTPMPVNRGREGEKRNSFVIVATSHFFKFSKLLSNS